MAGFYALGTRPPLFWLLISAIIWLAAARALHAAAVRSLRGCGMPAPYNIGFLVGPPVFAALGWAYELLAERAERSSVIRS